MVTACVNAVQFLAGREVANVTSVDKLNEFLAKHGLYENAGQGVLDTEVREFCKLLITSLMLRTHDVDGFLLSNKYEIVDAKPSDINERHHKKLSDDPTSYGKYDIDPIKYLQSQLVWLNTLDMKIAEIIDDPETDLIWRDNTQEIGQPYDIDHARVAILDTTYKYKHEGVEHETGMHAVVALHITEQNELDKYEKWIRNAEHDKMSIEPPKPSEPGWYLLDSNNPELLMHLYFDITQSSNFEPNKDVFIDIDGEKHKISFQLQPPFALIQLKNSTPLSGGRVAGGSGPVSGGASIAALLAGLAVTAVSSMVGASSVAP